jgi:hypothetical protein
MKIEWENRGADGWRATVGDVTLYASPDHTKAFAPKRGTTWRAGASRWEALTSTIYRYGRDVYGIQCKTAKEAMRLAETVFNEATP